MKVVINDKRMPQQQRGQGFGNITPTIPLVKIEYEYPKGSYTTIKGKTLPADDNTGTTLDIQVPYFKEGDPERLLDFLAKMKLCTIL